jgi:hypothetical protein
MYINIMDITSVFIVTACIGWIVTLYFNCSGWRRDYIQSQQITSRIWTEEDINIAMNDMHIIDRIPVAEGIKVNNIMEDLEIIDPD